MGTPYIIIPVTYNTYIAYIKANLIDLSDLVDIWSTVLQVEMLLGHPSNDP